MVGHRESAWLRVCGSDIDLRRLGHDSVKLGTRHVSDSSRQTAFGELACSSPLSSPSSHLGLDKPLLFSRARSRSLLRSRSRCLNVDLLKGLSEVARSANARLLDVAGRVEDESTASDCSSRPRRAAARARVGDASGVSDPAVDMLISAISASGANVTEDGTKGEGEGCRTPG